MKYIIFIIVAALIIWGAMVYRPGGSNSAKAPLGEQVATSTSATTNTINTATKPTAMPTGLKIEDVKVGTGAEAKSGDLVTVHYVGKLTNGTIFDASKNHEETANGFTFPLGQNAVIKGWELGVAGMKIGGIRNLTIPPELGYGSRAQGPIPANSTLLFQVELLSVRSS